MRKLQHFLSMNDRRVKEACFAEWDKTKGIFPKDLFVSLPPSLKSDALKRLYEIPLRRVIKIRTNPWNVEYLVLNHLPVGFFSLHYSETWTNLGSASSLPDSPKWCALKENSYSNMET
jgi:hypothetical protein